MSTNPLTHAAFARVDDFVPFGRVRDSLTATRRAIRRLRSSTSAAPISLAWERMPFPLVSTLPGLVAPPLRN
jgi:hypothetical protein